MRNRKIFLIHHAHTDIGYTDRQEKLTRYHVDFIRQAMDILDGVHAGKINAPGFKWQCENIWQLDNFFEEATEKDIERFKKYVQSGEIGLSGNYLNMTELVDSHVLLSRTMKAKTYAEKLGVNIDSGMAADINGYAWGYPDILASAGVENLFTALHSHHGMFPLGRKNCPFFWEGPNGNKVLSWVGEHYHMGNVLGFAPMGHSNYTAENDDRGMLDSKGKIYTTDAATTDREEIETMLVRVVRYLDTLEKEDYPFDFVPIMVSGSNTDNSPPSAAIARRVQIANEKLDNVTVKMSTLSEFFDYVRKNAGNIPTLRGDFTDWWADGVGSTANTVKVYRDAQRRYNLCRKLDPENRLGRADLTENAAQNLMMYAEHTWGYSTSVSEPWDSLVALLEKKKDCYAITANNDAAENLDIVLSKMGECSTRIDRPKKFKVINPHSDDYCGTAKLVIEDWEKLDGIKFNPKYRVIVRDEKTGEILPAQSHKIGRGYETETALTLKPHEERILSVTQDKTNTSMAHSYAHIGSEGIADIVTDKATLQMPGLLDTPYFRIEIKPGKGIASIIDKTTGKDLIMPGTFGAFSGFYEVTPADGLSQCEVRRRMGRNRRYISTRQYTSKLINSVVEESGEVYTTMKLTYELEGCHFYYVYLKVYKFAPIIEARACFHKKSEWNPENLFVMLPFCADGSNETFIDKTGCIMRPGIDQLPGTCQSFWLLQNGIVRKGEKRDIIIACKDAPLICFGEQKYRPVVLCDGSNTELNRSMAASWVMNNFWETNFKADLGGFYEFSYIIESVPSTDTAKEIKRCAELNEGVLGLYC